MKAFDLMFGSTCAGLLLLAACIPHLRASARAGRNPHILNLSPPLSLDPRWFAPHMPYTMAKYGMSLCVLAWPRSSAGRHRRERPVAAHGDPHRRPGHDPRHRPGHVPQADIMADAAHAVLTASRASTRATSTWTSRLAEAGVNRPRSLRCTARNQTFPARPFPGLTVAGSRARLPYGKEE